MIIHKRDIKGKEVFWYDDFVTWSVVIGVRGVGEYRIPKWEMERANDTYRIRQGRFWTDQEAIEWAINWATRESEYIDFEEVKTEPLRLNA